MNASPATVSHSAWSIFDFQCVLVLPGAFRLFVATLLPVLTTSLPYRSKASSAEDLARLSEARRYFCCQFQ